MTTDATRSEGATTFPLDSTRWARRLRELAEAHGVPGAALVVARPVEGGSRELVVATHGITNVATGAPVLPDTLFQIGSHTKIWTATLLMQLVDEGVLDLDEPVVNIVPGLRLPGSPTAPRITTRHLLTHQAGLDGEEIVNWDCDDRALERFAEQLAEAGRVTGVGELWSYSNNAFDLAGRIVEVLRGTTWERALRDCIVGPLGLDHVATSAEEAIVLSAAVGHLPGAGGRLRPTPRWGIPRKDNPAGGIATSVADLAEFMLMHLRGGVGTNGVRVLSDASARAMLVPQVVAADGLPMGELSGQGIGWHLSTWAGTAVFGHDGGTFGQYSRVLAFPAHDLVVAVTTGGGDILPLFDAVDDEIRDALGIPREERSRPEADPNVSVDAAVIGVYERAAMRCRVFQENGALRLGVTMSGPLHEVVQGSSQEDVSDLTVLSSRCFVRTEAEHLRGVEFLRTDGGEYLWLESASGVVPKDPLSGVPTSRDLPTRSDRADAS